MKIKQLQKEDSFALYNLIDISRAQLKNLTWSQTATLKTTEDFICSKQLSEDTVFGVFDENNLVAVLELRKKENFLELGYWVGSPYRHKGYMKEAVKLLVSQQTDTVMAHIREQNIASLKILQYAGLQYSHTEIWKDEPWIHFKKEKLIKKLTP